MTYAEYQQWETEAKALIAAEAASVRVVAGHGVSIDGGRVSVRTLPAAEPEYQLRRELLMTLHFKDLSQDNTTYYMPLGRISLAADLTPQQTWYYFPDDSTDTAVIEVKAQGNWSYEGYFPRYFHAFNVRLVFGEFRFIFDGPGVPTGEALMQTISLVAGGEAPAELLLRKSDPNITSIFRLVSVSKI